MDVRSIFLSDLHLGSSYCRIEELRNFLRGKQPEYLYLVGDIIDIWKIRRKPHWTDSHSFLIRKIIGMMKKGTRIRYVIGNHDEFLREFIPSTFGHLEMDNEFIHETADGRQVLVVHGDQFDQFTRHLGWLYHMGDRAYSFALWLNSLFNRIRCCMGLQYWSVSSILKTKVKHAANFINNFEHFVEKYALQQGCHEVICGHIHHPDIKQIGKVKYINCGDWLESCSAVVERKSGKIELIRLDSDKK